MSLERARAVADAVLYEGYLLYPYRATSSKNQSRWQWGVLGPPGAAAAGVGEESTLSTQCLLRSRPEGGGEVDVRLRFLQLQNRVVERVAVDEVHRFEPVAELRTAAQTWISWDEAVAHELALGPCPFDELLAGRSFDVHVDGAEEVEEVQDDGYVVGRLVRRRRPLDAVVRVQGHRAAGPDLVRLSVTVSNTAWPVAGPPARPGARWDATADKADAIARSLIGTHLLLVADDAEFVSLLEPPDDARETAATCQQQRCWPVLAGDPDSNTIVLASPIILYDYPEVAEQSAGALFDSTEIDEILTLRVMTLTDEEKAAARATDPRAAEIIDRCDQMTPESLQALHGVLREPRAGVLEMPNLDDVPSFSEPGVRSGGGGDIRNLDPPSFDTGDVPWWDPATDAAVQPEVDTVMVGGVLVGKDSLVRLHPSRRADAQDIFFAGQTARVTAVLSDVDGQVHVAVVMVDDPAADMHEWYGRYMYFAPEELEPLGQTSAQTTTEHREESRS